VQRSIALGKPHRGKKRLYVAACVLSEAFSAIGVLSLPMN